MVNEKFVQNNFCISYVYFLFSQRPPKGSCIWNRSQSTEGEKYSSWADKSPIWLHCF